MIEAFHSNWTKPFLNSSNEVEYNIEDFEILTTILSALKWRENNGKIKMITDEIGAEYYKKIKIESIWDLGIDTMLDNIDKDIDPSIFWAAGKIYSLRSQKAPCAMIDTDFIVWKPIENLIGENDICTIHKESISKEVYPNKSYFIMKNNFFLDNSWDWNVEPCNTSFTFIGNNRFKDYYTEISIDFMKNIENDKNKIVNMVFAEQRLISMCAKKMNVDIHELLPLKILAYSKQKYFTHLWGYKKILRENLIRREDFCINCVNRILKDFPQYEEMISNVPKLKKYFNRK